MMTTRATLEHPHRRCSAHAVRSERVPAPVENVSSNGNVTFPTHTFQLRVGALTAGREKSCLQGRVGKGGLQTRPSTSNIVSQPTGRGMTWCLQNLVHCLKVLDQQRSSMLALGAGLPSIICYDRTSCTRRCTIFWRSLKTGIRLRGVVTRRAVLYRAWR